MRRAFLTLWWERAYAAFLPVPLVILAFLGVSLLGLWGNIPGWLHIAGLLIAFCALGAAVWRALGQFISPTLPEALHRIETDSGLPHGTLQDALDTPFSGNTEDPFWQRHLNRLQQTIQSTRLAPPRSLIDQTDPYALRFLVLILFGLGIILAGDRTATRLNSAFSPNFTGGATTLVDLWIEPPDYTNKPPIFLLRTESIPDRTQEQVTVPTGSTLRLRMTRSDGKQATPVLKLATNEGQEPLPVEFKGATLLSEQLIDKDAALSLKSGGSHGIWPLSVTTDQPPRIEWIEAPGIEGGVRTTLAMATIDDYGVTSARLVLRLGLRLNLPPDAGDPSSSARNAEMSIDVAALNGPPGEHHIALDLTEHPWSGLPVMMVMEITDGAGQSARSLPVAFTLPERTFYNPLARTVIETRQSMALNPQSWARYARMFDALTFAPDRYVDEMEEYLLMRTAYRQLAYGEGENTDDIVEDFWPLAISLEDEGLTLARQRLEAAQEALRQALQNNAPQEEIDRLLEELRIAMDEYLLALAQSGDANAMNDGQGADLEGRDLQDILDEIAQLRRQGENRAAQERLAELERLLQNIQISQGSSGQGQQGQGEPGEDGEGEGNQSLDQAGALIDQQRRLSDDTYAASRGDRSSTDLSQSQNSLADAARELADQAAQDSATGQPGGAGQQAFQQAERAMREAAQDLARGNLPAAQARQEQALQALREGAQAVAEETLAQEGQGEDGDGEQRNASGNRQGTGTQRDPLGRAYGREGETGVEIPDLVNPERVRELTRSLRKRLSDPSLPAAERDYLERLLKRF